MIFNEIYIFVVSNILSCSYVIGFGFTLVFWYSLSLGKKQFYSTLRGTLHAGGGHPPAAARVAGRRRGARGARGARRGAGGAPPTPAPAARGSWRTGSRSWRPAPELDLTPWITYPLKFL